MSYSAMAVANAFIRRAMEGRIRDLSPMKLQKLMFYAQSWHLKVMNEPLLDDTFCRWQYGPVIPSIYHDFKHYGSGSINGYGATLERGQYDAIGGFKIIQPSIPDEDQNSWALIDKIIETYAGFSGVQLSAFTHQPGTAWAETGDPDGGAITNEQLAQYIR
jgi:uncharacterized phage-associated protein